MSKGIEEGVRAIVYPATTSTVPAAGTVASTPITGLAGCKYVTALLKFAYGSGGTTIKVFLQTSLDAGATWIDIMCWALATSSVPGKVNAVVYNTALAANVTPTDGTLTDNTILSGLIGDRLRVKFIISGTYTASTLEVDIVAKG